MAINIYSFNYLYSSHLIFIKKQIFRINRDKIHYSAGIMVDSSEIATRIASCIQIRTIFIIGK